ncbi:hypothetical protein HW49_00650 [Porphyromonadaceae bacterium COT-184 OH4590]|nr:hypothetical protein HW49_00650 [Porphyromonadaceae bacterium COT-184 OH4590]
MDKKGIINKIVETVKPNFEKIGFSFKSSNKFEKKNGNSLYVYEIDVTKSRTGHSLHLKLHLQNKEISSGVNEILKKVLKDPLIKYPNNFTSKIIEDIFKDRTSNKNICGLTDWRFFKKDEQSLEDFNKNFSIWFSTFEKLEDKNNWEVELIKSVNYAENWFCLVDNDTYLIEHTDYVSMYLLKRKKDMQKLEIKYDEICNRKKSQTQDTIELELFYKYLLKEV